MKLQGIIKLATNNSNSLLVFVCTTMYNQKTICIRQTQNYFEKLDFMRSDGGHSVIEQICKYFSILSSNLSNGKTHEHGASLLSKYLNKQKLFHLANLGYTCLCFYPLQFCKATLFEFSVVHKYIFASYHLGKNTFIVTHVLRCRVTLFSFSFIGANRPLR